MSELTNTPFSLVYNRFLSRITDDMYMELTQVDTQNMLQELLINAIYKFEFPRVNIQDYTLTSEYEDSYFNVKLTNEEINILAVYMVCEWLGQQIASVENTRMKYSGNDFKFTSQANHIQKLNALKKDYDREGFRLQRLYKRRRIDENGNIVSNFDSIISK